MTAIDVEIAALRQRRHGPSLKAWLRRRRPFDRRAIRQPDQRDAYWVRVQQRLAESDAALLMRRAPGRPERSAPRAEPLIG